MLRPLLFALATASVVAQPAETDANRFVDLFRPNQTELAALSPDGRHVAYTLREADRVSVVITAVDTPDQVRSQVIVLDDRSATPRWANLKELVPARINWLQWVTDDRIVVETNGQVAVDAATSIPGIIMTFNADGSDARTLVTPLTVRELVTQEQLEATTRNNQPVGATVDDPYFSAGGTRAVLDAAAALDPFEDDVPDLSADKALAAAQQLRGNSPVPTGGLFGTDNAQAAGVAPTDNVIDQLTGFGFNPLSPAVFGLDPAHPGEVLVRTTSTAYMVLYRLDPATGKLRQVHSAPIDSDHAYLVDRQGLPRISTPNTSSFAFPFHLTLERGPGAKRARDLTAAVGLTGGIGFTVSPDTFFTERAIPLGFGERPEILYYASNQGRDTYGIYAVDLATGKPTDIAIEAPQLDAITLPPDVFGPPGTLVYDRYTRNMVGVRLVDRLRTTTWINPALQRVQTLLEQSLPGSSIEIFDWDRQGTRFLASVRGPSEPGRFVLFDLPAHKLTEFARKAPWLDEAIKTKALFFTVGVKSGVDVRCQLTLPRNQKIKTVPVIVVCPSEPWERLNVEFQPEIQALANMGFAVLQVSARGAWGYGVRQREAIRNGYDDAQVADLVDVVDQISQSFAVDPKRVGLVGSGHGAYVALRAMELHPDRFRCGVAVEPQIDLAKWMAAEDWTARQISTQLVRSYYGLGATPATAALAPSAALITKPLLIFSYPGADGTWRRGAYLTAKAFAHDVRRAEVEVDFEPLDEYFAAGLPKAKAAVYAQIEDFLNAHVYDFTVQIGESVEVK